MRYHLLFFIVLLLFPVTSFAAELRLLQQPSSVRAGDTFIVTLLLHTGTDVVNAIEGSLHFSPALSLKDIRFDGSVIPLWISSPKEEETGVVLFAGILPGGYQGTGNVFTLLFEAVRKGPVQISYGADTKAYRNDGKGTPTALSALPLSLSVGSPSETPDSTALEEDTLPPEPFTPIITSGEPFGLTGTVLVFTTQDKSSGILRYDMARSYRIHAKEETLSWLEVQSPYAFVEGDSIHYLYIRAVDQAGLTRIAEVPPQEFSMIAFVFRYWILLVLTGIGGGVILFSRLFRRHAAHHAV